MATLQLKDIHKSYGDVQIIKGVDLAIEDREFCVFVGPSGCGKSTLLRMIAGLEEVSGGEVLIDGVRCDHLLPAARGMAMVFQSYALYPHMNVEQNLRFGLENFRTPKAIIDQRVRTR
ncbi:MAG TPA: ABC transporter ATP-binding protein, partial [Geminicoccaceae bacterium]|nr:ABC transporter ATP-binding protein [Geminicoccaceae bacterium]